MRIFSLSLLFFTLLLSCRKPAVEKPDDLISEDKIEDILYDLAILNSAKGISVKKFEETISPETYLYEKYEIDSAQFARSVMYYAAYPETYLALQKNVEMRLTEAKEAAEAAKKMSDSLKQLKKPDKDSLRLRREQDGTDIEKH